jgi:hypothetical protein
MHANSIRTDITPRGKSADEPATVQQELWQDQSYRRESWRLANQQQ